jgi:hypothetical protein
MPNLNRQNVTLCNVNTIVLIILLMSNLNPEDSVLPNMDNILSFSHLLRFHTQRCKTRDIIHYVAESASKCVISVTKTVFPRRCESMRRSESAGELALLAEIVGRADLMAVRSGPAVAACDLVMILWSRGCSNSFRFWGIPVFRVCAARSRLQRVRGEVGSRAVSPRQTYVHAQPDMQLLATWARRLSGQEVAGVFDGLSTSLS